MHDDEVKSRASSSTQMLSKIKLSEEANHLMNHAVWL